MTRWSCSRSAMSLACLLLLVPSSLAFGPFLPQTAEGRKLFGGYRIVPQSCKSEADSRHGVCMFNYECAQRKGEVIAACMDGFLFGACCQLPPGSSIPVEAAGKPVKVAIPAPSTVGMGHFASSTSSPIKSSTQRINSSTMKIKFTTMLPPIPSLRPVSSRPTPPTFKPTRKTTPRPLATSIPDEDVHNAASISHILNLLNDSSAIAEPIPNAGLELVFTTATSRPQPSLSTWVSVNNFNNRRPVVTTTPKPSYASLGVTTPGLGFVVTNGLQSPLTPRPTPSAPAPTVIVLGPFEQHNNNVHNHNFVPRPTGINNQVQSVPTPSPYRPEISSPEPVVADTEEPAFTVTTVLPEFSTPRFEDAELSNKVHVFVDKIVNSLAGDFQNLEDVVLSKKNITINAATTPTPSTTSRKPPRRPSTAKPYTTPKPPKKPTTPVTLITAAVEEEPIRPSGDFRKECGIRPLVKNGRIVGGKGATFGEWPWQVLVRESTWLGLFTKNKCGGVLITSKYVITAAHCQPGFLASLVAVFGEFDLSGELESRRSVVKNVRRVIIHRSYEPSTFENDIALLELESPVTFDQHIVPICLPDDDADFTGRVATVSGWGRLKYGGGVPSVLQEVQVPVIENSVCQEMFHTAGHAKSIISSFLCAGYANGQKDSCEGDSGGPLVVDQNGRWVLVGTVSHGIKCASPYLPGVYMRTTYYKPWLKTITGAS